MKQIYLLSFLLLMSCVTMAQLKGKVTTTDGRPAGGVNVTIKEKRISLETAEDGSFHFSSVKEGNYTLEVSHIGLETKLLTVTAPAEVSIQLSETEAQLDEVIVKSKRSLNRQPIAIGKMPVQSLDLPQSITVIAEPLIRDQQAQRLSDVLKNVNGVYLVGTRASTQETFSARGYGLGSNNLFKNGTRINSGTMPEMSSLERVEVLKGSAAILFGNVAPGGIVNMITKQPQFNWGAEVSMRAGSYDLYRPAVDVYGPISKSIAFRVNGVYESANSFRDKVSSERFYVNPSLLFKLGKKTSLLLQGDYLHHEFTPDFGIGSIDNTIVTPVPRHTFFGTDWQYAKTDQVTGGFQLKHELNSQWKLSINGNYQQYKRDYYSTERIQAVANGDWIRPLGRTNTRENYYTAQADLVGQFSRHTLLIGADAERYETRAYTYSFPATYDTINLLDPAKYTPRTDIPTATAIRYTETPVVRTGAYIQDLFTLSKKFKLLAGVRWSMQESKHIDTLNLLTNKKNTGGTIKNDQAFSPRAGIVYQPISTMSVFASYANNFSVNSGTDVFGNALKPSIIDQFELGIKNDFLKGRLSVNLTAYRIINHNLAQTAQFGPDGVTPNNNTALKALTGETSSDGIELDISGSPARALVLMAGYSYNYMRYTNTPDAKGNFVEGERLVNNPAHTANASAFYTLHAFKFGMSYNYVGKRIGGWNNTIGQAQGYDRRIPVDGFSTLDLSAGYSYKKLSIMAKVSNVTNSFNYYVHENYSVNPIPPTQLIATIGYRL